MCPFRLKSGTWLILAAIILLLVSGVCAKRLPARVFTSADGLGSSFVNYLRSDSRGFMWFCTRDGLSRFDGSRFVTYRIAEKDSPPGIENIYEARDGSYWITTTGGTYRFDPNMLSTRDPNAPTLNAERITGYRGELFEDSFGNFWLGSAGLFRILNRDGKFQLERVNLGLPQKPKTSFSLGDLDETDDGSLWIDSTWGLMRRLPDGRIVYFQEEIRESSGSLRMLVDSSGRIWLTRARKLFVMKPDPIESYTNSGPLIIQDLKPTVVTELMPDSDVRFPRLNGEVYQFTSPRFIDNSITKHPFQSSDGTIWLTSEDNLLQFAGAKLSVHPNTQGLLNFMSRMAEDREGNLWIGGRSGVVRLDRTGLISYRKEDGAASDRFLSITQGPDGTIYFGSPDSHISRFDGNGFSSVRLGTPPDSVHTWTTRNAFIDSKGDWWMLTNEKLYRFRGVSRFESLAGKPPVTVYGTENGLKSNVMFQIFEDSSGDIWVSTRGTDGSGHGLGRLKAGGSEFVSFTEEDGFPPNKSPSSFAEDRGGNIWLGFYEGGLARFDGRKFRVFGAEDGFGAAGVLTDLHLDSKGRLWITSASTGLFRIDDPASAVPALVQFSTSNGLTSNNIRTVAEDRFGRIYVGSARGVDRLSPDTGRVKRYSVADGLAADFVVDSFCDRNGDLWFATDYGLSRLTPTPDDRSAPPQVWIGGLRVAGEPRPTLELGSSEIDAGEFTDRQNNLQIDFYGIDFRAGETLRYQYRLEGSNADWSDPSESRTVTFANLRPAGYRFLVRAVNSEGIFSERPAVVSFVVLQPVWLRWWFLTTAGLLSVGFVVLLYRYRTNRLREVNTALRNAHLAEEDLRHAREERIAELERVRARIATDLHDDIGASLTQIAILSEVAQARANGDAALNEPLRKITDVSNELVSTMSDIVWSINPAKDHVSDLAQRMRRFASDLFASKGIGLQFLAPGDDGAVVIGSNVRREVFLIFKEAANNVVKHSGAKNARVELAVSDGEVSLRVSDDGRGFDSASAAPTDGGHGLGGMRRRVEELGGKLQIISEPGTGTTVALSLPLVGSAQV